MSPELLASLPDNARVSYRDMAKLMGVALRTLKPAVYTDRLPAPRRIPIPRAWPRAGQATNRLSVRKSWSAAEARKIYRDYRHVFRVNRTED